ncbi:MAG: type VI secretion system baseplate subunit TssF [Acidobacteria bacterium]|nr:type VI secretion system baseplate subunit TssF [Acidobacteriota bacterium]
MRDELLGYYERELTYLRQMGGDFAKRYPKIASRLQLEANRCEDPHVERMIESFALLAARVHLKLDDEFPEITQALLNVVYPHYTRPLPSSTIVQFQLDPARGKLTTALRMARGTVLHTRPAGGVACRFTTCYDTELWPIEVAEAQWSTPDRIDPPIKAPNRVSALRLVLRCFPGTTFAELGPRKLRFYLAADSAIAYTLYELLANNCQEILLRDPRPKFRGRPLPLPLDALRPVGFGPDEALLPYPARSLEAYRLLQEYFSFPEKFLFFELTGLEAMADAGFTESAEVLFLFDEFERSTRQESLEAAVNPGTFRLGCTPAVNLFPKLAEPILLTEANFEYRVIADIRGDTRTEVFSIDKVVCTREKTGENVEFAPFFSFRHGAFGKEDATFWQGTRRAVPADPDGSTEIWLTLVDLTGRPLRLPMDTLSLHCTCTNGDLPSRLALSNDGADFNLDSAAVLDRIQALHKPTSAVRPATSRDALWRLISHLSLNYLSLVEDGKDALQEMLRLYQFSARPHLDQQVEGITGVSSRRQFARVVTEHGISYVRGMYVDLELDEDRFVGGGAYLFSAVLENFLAQYVSMNSFSQLAVRTRQRKEVLREWPPKAGSRILL